MPDRLPISETIDSLLISEAGGVKKTGFGNVKHGWSIDD